MLVRTVLLFFVSSLIFGVFFIRCMNSNKINTKNIKPSISFYNLEAKSIDGEIISMNNYKGKKVLIVNVASQCGYTPQYESLQKLYEEYKNYLDILAFPSNDFLNQEPGSNTEIEKFCKVNFGVKFDMFEKISVKRNKNSIHKIYDWLSDKDKNGWNDKNPTWNFCKYLIDENGFLVGFWGPSTDPLSADIITEIKK